MKKRPTPASVDDYIAGFPAEVQTILRKIRATIRKAAPKAQESISYKIAAYKLNGVLIYFAGFPSHIGLYPITGSVREKFKKELAPYLSGKGTAKFPLGRPIPYALIARIVKFRAAENVKKAG